MSFLKKLGKYGVLNESIKNINGSHKKVKSESAIHISGLQKNNKKGISHAAYNFFYENHVINLLIYDLF